MWGPEAFSPALVQAAMSPPPESRALGAQESHGIACVDTMGLFLLIWKMGGWSERESRVCS